jgi:hypothetical protein
MNKIILLIIFLAYDLYGYSQLTFRKVRDTTWYVELKDSSVLYSKKLWARYSFKEGEYLLLDHNKKIPMSEVLRYKSRTGEYVREKGPVETYRIEKGGPRLFVYSRSFWYADSSGYHTDHHYFFRKGTTGDMLEMSYKNLKDAMADNAASMRELEASRSTILIAGAGGVVGFLLTVIGGAQSLRKNSDRFNTSQPSQPTWPVRPGQPIQPTQARKSYTSPLLIAGPVIMIGAMITLLTAPGHIQKSINIYNQ